MDDQAFSPSYYLAPPPSPATHRKTEKERRLQTEERVWVGAKFYDVDKSLVLYKSFNTLCFWPPTESFTPERSIIYVIFVLSMVIS
jgi:hypothetical protein